MKSSRLCCLALAWLLCGVLAASAWAENRPGAFTLTPFVGGQLFEGDQRIEDELTYGLGLGFNLTRRWGMELAGSYVDTAFESPASGDVKALAYHLDVLYNFMPSSAFVPYLAIGGGAITFDPDGGGSETEALGNYGFGLKSFFTDNLALRFDARHLLYEANSDLEHNLLMNLGLNLNFGGAKAAPPPRPEPEPPRDSDGDGVYDDHDRCPGTPSGVRVDARGCPLDSDGDGVADHLDKCPGTPKGAPVDNRGCPLDSDADGVADHLDQCPGTPKGTMVDETGCDLKFTLHIEFDTDKAQIRPEYHAELAKAAEFTQKYQAPTFLIAGHTDNVGSADYNAELSLRRAESVRRYLIEKFGIPAERLVARGYGLTKPVADNRSAEGRQKNRRVEVICCVVIPE
ncbi:membrane protein [Desulfuromonas versatilis]|uniref:Membrane protein n=1 Tax=Desulfuromonas versatilis TaxID=2802975 RepID=A0ABN6E0I3_9BACT|nr:OmpA family protein [Desulfuromonas versatilis]BCR05881.1 membrane protein [Desulfuromonas versatilis]